MALKSSARRNWCRGAILGAAFLATVGCTGKDKSEQGLRSMDPRAKAALTATDGPPLSIGAKPKFATGDPSMTGTKDQTVRNSFDRKTPHNPPATLLTSVTPAPGTPTNPTTGGSLPLQPRDTAPPVLPRVVEHGALPLPDLKQVGGTSQLDKLSPPPEPITPQPMNPIIAMPAITPPLPPAGLPAAPPDTGLQPLQSITEKPVNFPITPTSIK
jgi:hypothetical protein